VIRDPLVSLLTSLLLAVATLAGLAGRLLMFVTHWIGRESGRASVWVAQLHSVDWKLRREEERFERLRQER
jgi:hypothetical protein